GIRTGGLLKIGPDEKLYLTIGDLNRPALAQNLQSPAGKVLRYNLDGSIPPDNPFPGSPIFTLGHGNVFGMAFHPLSGRAYVTDNGPDRDDEVNVLDGGANYGWPVVMGKTGDPRFVDPILTFTPTIAPTGAAFYTGDRYPRAYRHNLFFGAWNTGQVYRVVLAPPAYRRVVKVEMVLPARLDGIVDVAQGADGYLYFTTRSAIHRITRLP
ncbi:MAG: PQQ-dependent sugar dehydrogenase, partial [Armatimonadetes bacterium]|nr:PQQ-dependent sugar dehydrogenase [Armatimonadota bacterium]